MLNVERSYERGSGGGDRRAGGRRATLGLGVAMAVSEFPRGLGVLACVLVAGACAWYGVLRRGVRAWPGWRVAALALAGRWR